MVFHDRLPEFLNRNACCTGWQPYKSTEMKTLLPRLLLSLAAAILVLPPNIRNMSLSRIQNYLNFVGIA